MIKPQNPIDIDGIDNPRNSPTAAAPQTHSQGPLPPHPAFLREPPAYSADDASGYVSKMSSTTTLRADDKALPASVETIKKTPEKTAGKPLFYQIDIEKRYDSEQERAERNRFRPSNLLAYQLSAVAAATVDALLFVTFAILFFLLIFFSVRCMQDFNF